MNFITEFTNPPTASPKDDPSDSHWVLNVDGLSTANSIGTGVVLVTPVDHKIEHALCF